MKALLILMVSTFGVDGAGTSTTTTVVEFATELSCRAAAEKLGNTQVVEQPVGIQKKVYGITVARAVCVTTK